MNYRYPCILIYLFFFISVISCKAQSDEENIALNKSYNFSEKPNYKLTEGNDYNDLTDGEKKTGSHFWQDSSTVGWQGIEEVEIDLDLEEEKGIDNIRINTAQNDRGTVQFPEYAFVFLSNDNEDYIFVGDLMDKFKQPINEYAVREFELGDINKKARYVKFVFIPNGKYIFLDEIEVNSISSFGFYGKIKNDKALKKEQINAKVEDLIENSAIGKKLFFDIQDYLNNHPNKERWTKKLSSLSYKDIEDLKELKKEVSSEAFSQSYGESTLEGFIVTPINIWENRLNSDYEIRIEKDNTITLKGLVGSSQYGAFQIVNTSKTTERFSMNIGCDKADVDFFEIGVSPSMKRNVYDAMVPLEESGFTIEAGEKKHIVFKINTDESCESFVSVQSSSLKKEIPLSMKIISPPDEVSRLNANVWAYLDYPVIKDNKKEVIQDLFDHQINTIVINGNHLPKIGDNNFQKLREYLSNFESLKDVKILLYTNHKNKSRRNTQKNVGFLSENWQQTFKNWYKELLATLSEIDVNKNQVYWYPFDEIQKKNVQEFIQLSKWASKELPDMQLFVTINKKEALQVIPHASISQITPSYSKEAKKKYPKAEIWQYTVIGMSREKDAYSDYRLMAWEAFYRGYEGIGFWNYLDLRKNTNLNNYSMPIRNKSNDYGVVYTDSQQNIISSRRWEAFNKGIEDYQILQLHEKKFGKKKTKSLAQQVIQDRSNTGLADKIGQVMIESLDNK